MLIPAHPCAPFPFTQMPRTHHSEAQFHKKYFRSPQIEETEERVRLPSATARQTGPALYNERVSVRRSVALYSDKQLHGRVECAHGSWRMAQIIGRDCRPTAGMRVKLRY
jgi:hypothetical protein